MHKPLYACVESSNHDWHSGTSRNRNRLVAPYGGYWGIHQVHIMSRVLSCDVHLHFDNGQPSYTCYIGEADRASDKKHAIRLAKLNAQAKGWDIRHCDEAVVTGLIVSRK